MGRQGHSMDFSSEAGKGWRALTPGPGLACNGGGKKKTKKKTIWGLKMEKYVAVIDQGLGSDDTEAMSREQANPEGLFVLSSLLPLFFACCSFPLLLPNDLISVRRSPSRSLIGEDLPSPTLTWRSLVF